MFNETEVRTELGKNLYIELYEHHVPPHIHHGIVGHVLDGHPVGGFLTALFENNLREAFAQADDVNIAAMREIVTFCYNCVPSLCLGGKSQVASWRNQGGVMGIARAAEAEAKNANV
jgi:hypothetical protein